MEAERGAGASGQGYPMEREGGGCGRTLAWSLLALVAGGALTLIVLATVARGLLGWLLPSPSVTVPTLVFPTPAPTATPRIITGPEVVRQIQQMSRLQTTAYTVQTVITVERPGNALGIGRQRLLMIVYGTVTAGVDLSKLRASDVTVSPDGKRLRLRLPEAEILSNALDETRTQVYDFQTGLFTQPDPNLIMEGQRAGAAQILQTACRDGILQRSTADSHRAIAQLLTLVGFESIEMEEAPVPTCPGVGPSLPPAPTPVPAATVTPGPARKP
jgi:hypothetical protein